MNLSQNDQWYEDLVLELRLRDIRGEAIGDAVAAARSHCDDSGETPVAAFGDAREYGRSLEFSRSDVVETSLPEWGRVLAPVAAGLVGFSLVTSTVTAVLKGEAVNVAWGAAASALVLALVVLFVLRYLRLLLDRPVAGILVIGSAWAVMVMLPILWSTPAFSVPALVAALVGLAFLAGSVVLGRRVGDLSDPVVDPMTNEDRYGTSRPAAWKQLFTGSWLFVTWTVLVGLLLCALHYGFA